MRDPAKGYDRGSDIRLPLTVRKERPGADLWRIEDGLGMGIAYAGCHNMAQMIARLLRGVRRDRQRRGK